ncbi:MAG: peptidase S1 [Bacteroidota bacterium]
MTALFRTSLLATALVLSAGAAWAQPDRSGTPATTLAVSGDDTASTSVTAGGRDRVAVQGSGCSGFITNGTPTAAVTWSGSGALSIYATASGDATLVVADPDGRWHCSDDASLDNSNPAVTFAQGKSGRYLVWVGMIGAGTESATLKAKAGQPAW